jgi:hypothetical protein
MMHGNCLARAPDTTPSIMFSVSPHLQLYSLGAPCKDFHYNAFVYVDQHQGFVRGASMWLEGVVLRAGPHAIVKGCCCVDSSNEMSSNVCQCVLKGSWDEATLHCWHCPVAANLPPLSIHL